MNGIASKPAGALRAGVVLGMCSIISAAAPRVWSSEEAAQLTVCLLSDADSGNRDASAALAGLRRFLESELPGKYLNVACTGKEGDRAAIRGALGSSEVAVLFDQQETVSAAGLDLVREFVGKGKGLVVLRARTGSSEAWKKFEHEVLGVAYGGPFPREARLSSISMYPHPIFTGNTDAFETTEELSRATVKADAVILMEGAVGEFFVPMAWLRPYQRGRIFNFTPAAASLFHDRAYLKIVANGIRWVAGRDIPGARTSVQRTYMANAYPGAFAITFPRGPGVCYDPEHGGVAYVWDGDFVDVRPWYTAKHGAAMTEFAARPTGEIFYQEGLAPAFHAGGHQEPAEFRYLGYQMRGNHPEFKYKVGERIVTERLQATEDGLGIVRRYTVGPGQGPLWVSVGPPADKPPITAEKASVTVDGAVMTETGDRVRFDATDGGEFTVTIRKNKRSDR